MEQAIQARQLTKTFNGVTAVDALDLSIPRGGAWGFIGPSGAGKTTTIRLIMSILFPDSGSLRVLGHDSAFEVRRRIGYLPEERGVYAKMRVEEFLLYLARLRGVDDNVARQRAARMLEQLGLNDVQRKRCEDLSKGMLQRVQFVGAILHEPELLILDEPFSGLDPLSVRALKEMIRAERQRGATLLFSTHVMAQAEELCDQVVMIHKGRKVLDESTARLRRQFDARRILFEPLDLQAELTPLCALAGVESLQAIDNGYELRLREDADTQSILRAMSAALPLARLELARRRVEDVFIDLVGEQELRVHLRGVA
ncbi:MAG: ATP-binding cassette domain-containing protein [Pseudomonadales bacterium]|jgi:ABC-2 type transport system ATP-binding protein|nr:ATP-binding cassette domain-containing protein [Pseudomonadales bacterium]